MQSDVPPLVTVVLPVYNAGKHLRLAVLSILEQTFSNWELLIVDDGSADNALKDIVDISDARVHVFWDGENKGLAARLNEGIDLARGRYFARMDQDDISHPERLARQLASLQDDKLLDLVGVHCLTISENNEIVGILAGQESHEDICVRPWLGFHLPHPTWMGKTSWFREYRYTLPEPYCCEDQELLLRSHAVSRFHIVPEFLLAYRVRDRLDLKKAWRTRRTLHKFQRKYFFNNAQYLYMVLASASFFLRVVRDILVLAKQVGSCKVSKHSTRVAISYADAASWRQIIQHLHEMKITVKPTMSQ